MRIQCFQHISFETPAYISEWAENKGHSLSYTYLYNAEKLPSLNTFDILLIMGGPMGANDNEKHPWLKAEKELIAEAIKNNKKVLGICLGSQLIASALGAKVYPNKFKEVGFWPIYKKSNHQIISDFPDSIMAFHWHGDTYDLPRGAELLFSSEGCVNQAYIFGSNVLALQFHFEVTESLIDTWFSSNEKQETGKYIQTKEEIFKGKTFIPTCNLLLCDLLEFFLKM